MATYYVATNGSDSNPGSSDRPVKSITKGASLARGGDTVVVRPGTYTGHVAINNSGSASAPVTIRSEQSRKAIIDGNNTGSDLVVIGGDYTVFDGFEVRNSGNSGVVFWNAHHTTVKNCLVHDNKGTGVYIGGDDPSKTYDNIVESCEVHHNYLKNKGGAMGGGGWGMGINSASSDRSIIRDCYSHHNWGEGIGLWSSIKGQVRDCIVHDNWSVNVYLDNAQEGLVQNCNIHHTYDEAYYRKGEPSHSVLIGNEVTDRQLPSRGITVTNNTIGGGKNDGRIDYWAQDGAQYTELENCKLEPNNHVSPEEAHDLIDDGGGSTEPPVEPPPAEDKVVTVNIAAPDGVHVDVKVTET